jgi:cell division protein FtsN
MRLAELSSSLAFLFLISFISSVQASEPSAPSSWITQAPREDVQIQRSNTDTNGGDVSASDAVIDTQSDFDSLDNSDSETGDRPDVPPPIPADFQVDPNSGNVIILGQPESAPYVVAIPGSRDELLDRVQERVPQAFLTDSRRGRYVQAGAFSTRSEAEALSCQLRHQGFDARVVYFRVR